MTMRVAILCAVLLVAGPAAALEALLSAGPGFEQEHPAADAFYSQTPTYYLNINASSAHSSEVCDDVPDSLAGTYIGTIRLYVAEWLAVWSDPESLVVRFYDGQCPPPLAPSTTYTIPWAELETELVHEQAPRTVYMVDATLDPPYEITEDTSVGVYSVIGWPEQPYTGVCMTPLDDVFGCGEAYLVYPPDEIPRWTQVFVGTGYHTDLAYSLWEPDTAVPEVEPGTSPTTWGAVKASYR